MFGKKLGKPHDFKFSLGDKLKDIITGFSGICVSRSQWISNCNTYGLKSVELKDGKPLENEHFDEPVLTLVKEKVHKENRDTGGLTLNPPTANRIGF